MSVSSHNEWDPLKEVIVGDGFPDRLPAMDYTFRLYFHDNLWESRDYQFGDCFVSRRHVQEHREDLEQFVELLESLKESKRAKEEHSNQKWKVKPDPTNCGEQE